MSAQPHFERSANLFDIATSSDLRLQSDSHRLTSTSQSIYIEWVATYFEDGVRHGRQRSIAGQFRYSENVDTPAVDLVEKLRHTRANGNEKGSWVSHYALLRWPILNGDKKAEAWRNCQYTLPSSCSFGVSTPYLATFSEETLFEWLSGLLTPDMCDMVRPTWLDVADGVAEDAPLLADRATVPEAKAAVAVDDDTVPEPSLPPSLVLRGVVNKRVADSESSTRNDGKSNSCCLSMERRRRKRENKNPLSINQVYDTFLHWTTRTHFGIRLTRHETIKASSLYALRSGRNLNGIAYRYI